MATADLLLHPVRLLVAERRVRGALERTYVLRLSAATVTGTGPRRRLLGSVLLPADDADPDRHDPTGRSS